MSFIIKLKNTYKDMPLAAKAALWFTACNFFVAGLGFITGPLFTRLLPPEEYGTLTLYMTYEQIILILATWEIQVGAYQRGLFKYEGRWDQYSLSTLVLVNLLTSALFLVVILLFKPISEFTKMSGLTLSLVFLYLITNPAYFCWITRKRTTYDYKAVVGVTVLYALLNIVIPLLAVLNLGGTAAVKFNATLITSVLIYLFFYYKTWSSCNTKWSWDEVQPQWKYMIGFQAPLVLHSMSYLVLGQADRIMIGKMVGDKEAAFYGVAYTLASVVTILQSSLNQALTPWRYSKLKENNYPIVSSSTNIILILLGASILMVVLIAPELMKILFTDDYYEAVWCIPPVSVSVFFMFLYSTFVTIESYYEKTKYIMYVSVFCGLINILLNYLLIPVFGYIVCGYTTLLSYILFAILHFLCMKIVCDKAIPGIHIFSISKIFLISLGLVVGSIVSTFLYNYLIVRYLIVAIMIIIALINKNKIKEIASSIRSK